MKYLSTESFLYLILILTMLAHHTTGLCAELCQLKHFNLLDSNCAKSAKKKKIKKKQNFLPTNSH